MRNAVLASLALLAACGGTSSLGTSGVGTPDGGVGALPGQLAAPTNFAVLGGNTSITLSWTAVSGASTYEVRRGGTLIATVAATSFVDTGLVNGQFYLYAVRGLDAAGKAGVEAGPQQGQPFRAVCIASNAASGVAAFNAEIDVDSDFSATAVRSFGGKTNLAPMGIATDFQHQLVYAANQEETPNYSMFALNAAGNVPPSYSFDDGEFNWDLVYDPTGDNLLAVTSDSVKTYKRATAGNPQLVRKLAVSDGVTFGAEKVVLSGPAHGDRMFVVDLGNPTHIYVYHRTDAGPAQPIAAISPPVFFNTRAIAYDPAHDELLLGTFDGSIVAIPASGNGAVAATRTLSGNKTGLGLPTALAVDPARGILYSADASGLASFPLGFADGANIAPIAVLSGPHTLASGRTGTIDVDETTGDVVLQTAGSIAVYGSAPAGDLAPVSAITTAATGLESPGGIAFDRASNELLVANNGVFPSITAFDADADGAGVTPKRSLQVDDASTIFAPPNVLFDDARGEMIYAGGADSQISFYARGASGNDAPLRVIGGSNTQIFEVSSIAQDADSLVVNDANTIRRFSKTFTDGNEAPLNSFTTPFVINGGVAIDGSEIFVTNDQGVAVYDAAATGSATPLRTLNLQGATQVMLDHATGELFVMDVFGNFVQVFPRSASGDAKALRRIVASGLVWKTTTAQGMTFCN
jgi:hypothetical protein